MVVLPLEGTRFAARLILANPCLGKRAPYTCGNFSRRSVISVRPVISDRT
jgi:hypothetical protein